MAVLGGVVFVEIGRKCTILYDWRCKSGPASRAVYSIRKLLSGMHLRSVTVCRRHACRAKGCYNDAELTARPISLARSNHRTWTYIILGDLQPLPLNRAACDRGLRV